MQLFLGVDGGGSTTRALVASADGSRIGVGKGGPSTVTHVTQEIGAASIRASVQGACAAAGVESPVFSAAFLGMAGVTCADSRQLVFQNAALAGVEAHTVAADHDIRIALAGGLALAPGIALIAGTGSSCYGRNAKGQTWQAGGWGPLLDDVGSAYALGREAMIAAVRAEDGRWPATALREIVFDSLGIRSALEIMDRIHSKGFGRPEIAALAPMVVEAAVAGDSTAAQILQEGAEELALMVNAVAARLFDEETPRIIATGGLAANPHYRALISAEIMQFIPGATLEPEQYAPVAGALLLAVETAGEKPSPALLTALERINL